MVFLCMCPLHVSRCCYLCLAPPTKSAHICFCRIHHYFIFFVLVCCAPAHSQVAVVYGRAQGRDAGEYDVLNGAVRSKHQVPMCPSCWPETGCTQDHLQGSVFAYMMFMGFSQQMPDCSCVVCRLCCRCARCKRCVSLQHFLLTHPLVPTTQKNCQQIKTESGVASRFQSGSKLTGATRRKIKWEFFDECYEIESWRATAVLVGATGVQLPWRSSRSHNH